MSFTLSSKSGLPLNQFPTVDNATSAHLLHSPFCHEVVVKELWKAKDRLDELWQKPPPPMGRSLIRRVALAQLFPHSSSGKVVEQSGGENRAGGKLEELAEAVGLLKDVPPGSSFLDLCGGPGAWSQFLLGQEDLQLHGWGFTLRSGSGKAGDWQAQDKDMWYQDLLGRQDWRAMWGADGTGDLLKLRNLEHCAGKIRAAGGAFLCLADGGFSDPEIPPNQLELYFYRLLLAELLMAVSCLQQDGRFVCKLYTS